MIKQWSISLRLTAWYASISAVGLAVFGVVMWFVLANSMISWKDRTLQTRAAHIEATLNLAHTDVPQNDASQNDDVQALNRKLEETVGALPEGEWIEIAGADGQILFPTHRMAGPGIATTPCATTLYRDILVGRERFRELCRPVIYRHQPAYLLVPSPLSEDRVLLGNFTSGLYRMVPILLLVSGLGGYLLSLRALAPVDVVIAEAHTLSAKDLSRRLTVSTADDQLQRLAVEWNGLLSRIESAMVRVTQFTADASHELRSPIAFIRTTAEFHLRNSALNDDLRETFVAILDETTVAAEMLEGLLLLARLDAEEIPMPSQPVDVYAVLFDLALHFAPSLRKRRQELTVSRPVDGSPLLRMGAGHLRRVLTAVLDNAIKYTPDEGSICVASARSGDLQLRITDTGMGIPAEYLNRIFDRFFRVDEARTSVEEGVGLGLSIAKRLLEQYGGSISVMSQVGVGTSVVLTFPEGLITAKET